MHDLILIILLKFLCTVYGNHGSNFCRYLVIWTRPWPCYGFRVLWCNFSFWYYNSYLMYIFSSAVCWKENHCIILQASREGNPTIDKETKFWAFFYFHVSISSLFMYIKISFLCLKKLFIVTNKMFLPYVSWKKSKPMQQMWISPIII